MKTKSSSSDRFLNSFNKIVLASTISSFILFHIRITIYNHKKRYRYFYKHLATKIDEQRRCETKEIFLKTYTNKFCFIKIIHPKLILENLQNFIDVFRSLIFSYDSLQIKIFAGLNVLILYIGFIYIYFRQSYYGSIGFIELDILKLYKSGFEAIIQRYETNNILNEAIVFIYLILTIELTTNTISLYKKDKAFPNMFFYYFIFTFLLVLIIPIANHIKNIEAKKSFEFLSNNNISAIYSDTKYNYISAPKKASIYLVPITKKVNKFSEVEKNSVLHIEYSNDLKRTIKAMLEQHKSHIIKNIGKEKYSEIIGLYTINKKD